MIVMTAEGPTPVRRPFQSRVVQNDVVWRFVQRAAAGERRVQPMVSINRVFNRGNEECVRGEIT